MHRLVSVLSLHEDQHAMITFICFHVHVFYADLVFQEKTEKTGDVGPCSTLFIANLGPNCTEDELKQVFSL